MRLSAPGRITQARRSLARCASKGKRHCLAVLTSLLLFGCCAVALADDLPLKDQPHLRRPVAAAWLQPDTLLAVANQRSGSISIVDIAKHKVLAEVAVGERLADVAALPSSRWFLAVDEARHELLVLRWAANELEVGQRIAVSRYPVNIAVSPDGSRYTVASLWSRTITAFGIAPAKGSAAPEITRLNELELGFAPGAQVYLPDGRHVVVADAFAGRMAVIDVTDQSVVELPASDIFRVYAVALSFDREGLYVAHQALRPLRGYEQVPAVVRNNEKA